MSEMKGFVPKTKGDGIFFSVKHGSLVRESKTAQDGFREIEVDNPRTKQKVTKFIQEYDRIEAMVTKIEWYDTEQQYETRYRGWKIHLEANGKKGVLDLPIQSRAAGRFMKLAENIDYTKPVEFRAWPDRKTDSTAFMVAQNDVSVPQKYTRENPGDLPPAVEKLSGKWNYDDQTDYLYKRMIDVVIPKVAALQPEPQEPADDEAHGEEDADTAPPVADEKLLETVKKSLSELAEHEDYQDRTRAQLIEEFFGASKFSEIEAMPAGTIKLVLGRIDKIVIPF